MKGRSCHARGSLTLGPRHRVAALFFSALGFVCFGWGCGGNGNWGRGMVHGGSGHEINRYTSECPSPVMVWPPARVHTTARRPTLPRASIPRRARPHTILRRHYSFLPDLSILPLARGEVVGRPVDFASHEARAFDRPALCEQSVHSERSRRSRRPPLIRSSVATSSGLGTLGWCVPARG